MVSTARPSIRILGSQLGPDVVLDQRAHASVSPLDLTRDIHGSMMS
jgi:hypothetical protein